MTLTDLLKEFNVVIDTAEGLTELRSLILGLAVRGKLMPQNPEDELASELLKKIEAEKQRLFEQGEIKKPKKLKPVNGSEIPFEIPDSWVWSRLGDIYGDIGTINPESIFSYLDVGSINNSRYEIDYSKVENVEAENAPSRARRKVKEGSVIYSTVRPYLKNVAIVTDSFEYQPIASTAFEVMSVFKGILNTYLYRFLLSNPFLDYVNFKMVGVAYPAINKNDMQTAIIPLPPSAEQHRIVAKIEALFAEVDELEEKLNRQTKLDEKLQLAVNAEVQQAPDAEASQSAWNFITNNFETLYHTPETIDNLKKNILNEAVRGRLVSQNPNDEPASELLKKIEAEKQRLYKEGEIRKPKELPPVKEDEIPFEIPESWEWVHFNEMAEFINGDRSKNYPNKEEYVEVGVPWINTGHIEPNGTLSKFNMNFITEDKFKSLRSGKIKLGDLVYCLRGATFGKTAFITPYDRGAIASSLMIVRPVIVEMGNYIYHFLVGPFGRKQLFRFDNGSAQPNLSANSVRMYHFPLPPLEEQHRIVQRIEELFAICDRFKAQLGQSQAVNEKLVKGLVGEVLEGS